MLRSLPVTNSLTLLSSPSHFLSRAIRLRLAALPSSDQIALFSIVFVTYKITSVAVNLRIHEEDETMYRRLGGVDGVLNIRSEPSVLSHA